MPERPSSSFAVGLIVHRVVADLLERRDGGEHRTLALGRALFGLAGRDDQAVDDRLVEADLLGGHRTVIELVDAIGQLGGDGGLGLGAAVDQDAVERPQAASPPPLDSWSSA